MKKIVYTILIQVFVLSLTAQVEDSTKLNLENVEVIKKFKTNLEKNSIIKFEKPPLPNKSTVNLSEDFDFQINPPDALEVEIPDPEIRTLAYVEEKNQEESNNGYVKAGYGNLKSPELLAQYHYFIEDWFEVGLKTNYYKAEDKNNVLQKQRQLGAGLYASYFLNDRTKVKASLDGNWDKVYFYHPDFIAQDFEEDNYKKNINHQNGSISFHHIPFQKSGIVFNTEFKFDHISLADSLSQESILGINNHMGKRFGSDNKTGLYLDFNYSFINRKTQIDTSQSRIALRPYLMSSFNNISAKLGIHYDNFDVIWPVADLSYKFYELQLKLFLIADVDAQINSLDRINDTNPFWLSNNELITQYAAKKLALGASKFFGDLFSEIQFARIDHINNLFFLRYNGNSFSSLVEDMEEYSINFRSNYAFNNFLEAEIDINKRFLEWEGNRDPDYQSDFIASVGLKQKLLDDKLVFKQLFFYENAKPFFDIPSQLNKTIPAVVDLNLLIDLRVSNTFNVYASLNNLLNNRYSYYDGYENFGRNFHGGIKIVL